MAGRLAPAAGILCGLIVSAALTCPLTGAAGGEGETNLLGAASPIDLASAREAFDLARVASDADAGGLWGVRLYGPTLFVDPETRSVVANEPEGEGRLVAREGLFLGTLPEELTPANTAVAWGGKKWTMLLWPIPEQRYARARLLVHESFHRIQDDLGLAGPDPANRHLETQEGRTWLRLEWRALEEALIRQDAPRRVAAEDALIFRAYRRTFDPRARAEEAALERNEGLAEYTGMKLSGWPDRILADRAAVRLGQDESAESFVRSFAYATGPAYGVLLDEAGVSWRAHVTADSDLGEMLGAALNVRLPGDLAGEAARRARRYGGDEVIAFERARAESRRARLAEYEARFQDRPVLILALGGGARYSFDPHDADAFGEAGTVYRMTRVTDRWGALEVTKGALLSRDAGGRVSEARVPAPGDTARPLEGDGWTLTLREGWKVVAGERPGDYVLAAPE